MDVIESIHFADDGVAVYEDRYLDVYFTPQGDLVVDVRDELDAAYLAGELTQEQYDGAIEECEKIVSDFCSDLPAAHALCDAVLDHVLKRIADGEIMFKEKKRTVQKD